MSVVTLFLDISHSLITKLLIFFSDKISSEWKTGKSLILKNLPECNFLMLKILSSSRIFTKGLLV